MLSNVQCMEVRYVQPDAETEERLRRVVCRLQALSILRAAEAREAGSSGARCKGRSKSAARGGREA